MSKIAILNFFTTVAHHDIHPAKQISLPQNPFANRGHCLKYKHTFGILGRLVKKGTYRFLKPVQRYIN